MITAAEGAKLKKIKSCIKSGLHVAASEKQWVLDVVRREAVVVPSAIVQRATENGYNAEGILTN